MTTKTRTHEKVVEYAACNLIENKIVTRAGEGSGIDLVLDIVARQFLCEAWAKKWTWH